MGTGMQIAQLMFAQKSGEGGREGGTKSMVPTSLAV